MTLVRRRFRLSLLEKGGSCGCWKEEEEAVAVVRRRRKLIVIRIRTM